jgi:hypothetical protein
MANKILTRIDLEGFRLEDEQGLFVQFELIDNVYRLTCLEWYWLDGSGAGPNCPGSEICPLGKVTKFYRQIAKEIINSPEYEDYYSRPRRIAIWEKREMTEELIMLPRYDIEDLDIHQFDDNKGWGLFQERT